MKKMMLISAVVMLGLFLGITVQAQTYNATGDFWKEKFFGGGPGQPGNTLMAVGVGFVFQNAVLLTVEGPYSPPGQWCENVGGAASYRTTYVERPLHGITL